MWEEILKAIPVYLSSMLKFILGPISGYAAGLNLVTTILATVAGMMTIVLAFAFFGNWIHDKVINRFFKRKRATSSERKRKLLTIWKKYGIAGVAALTPLILTPIGGTLIAISFGTPRDKLIFYMFLSAAAWAVVFSGVIYFFGNEVVPDIIK
jgi:membrane protein DedA with SNARE-associated domain